MLPNWKHSEIGACAGSFRSDARSDAGFAVRSRFFNVLASIFVVRKWPGRIGIAAGTLTTFLASAALADTSLEPPARFDRAYSGEMMVHSIPKATVNAECAMSAMKAHVVGCSFFIGDLCVVLLATGSNVSRDLLYRHERAHCNGWSAEHEE